MNSKIYTDEDQEIVFLYELWKYANHHPLLKREKIDEIYLFFEDFGYIAQEDFDFIINVHKENEVENYFNGLEDDYEYQSSQIKTYGKNENCS